MIKWFKSKHENIVPEAPDTDSQGWIGRFKRGLSKTRDKLGGGVARLLLGKNVIDADLLEELETALLLADVGVETTSAIIAALKTDVQNKRLNTGDEIYAALQTRMRALLVSDTVSAVGESKNMPHVILMVGVNGAGKTTTIGKLAKHYQQMGKKVMLAAGDTFRAAAVEQLQTWGERNQIPVIAQHTGADSASVIFDALQAAKARNIDILIADTAGRLHTQTHLMTELKKVKRVLQKIDPAAPHETLLVLDASIGQNALSQARQFHDDIELTGIVMTKLDGTAKGGILFAIASELKLPFRYIGVGEGIDDLRPFDAEQFVTAIFEEC